MTNDPYKVLGVTPSTPMEDVTKAYRRLAKQYHPDLHPGDKDAERRMAEINEAYELIKRGEAGAYSSSGRSGQSAPGGQGYGGYGSQGGQGGYGPFGPFGPFGGYGQQSGYEQRAHGRTYIDSVKTYIQAGQLEDALSVLQQIPNRDAEWYYLSAVAHSGLGNRVMAISHAQQAVKMEPNVQQYRDALSKLQQGGELYHQQGQGFGFPFMNANKLCLGFCVAQMLCRFCGYGCC